MLYYIHSIRNAKLEIISGLILALRPANEIRRYTEMSLQSNGISHWLGTNFESVLLSVAATMFQHERIKIHIPALGMLSMPEWLVYT